MFNTPLSFEAVILILIAYALFISWVTWLIVRRLIREHHQYWKQKTAWDSFYQNKSRRELSRALRDMARAIRETKSNKN